MDITDIYITVHADFPVGTVDKNPPANAGEYVYRQIRGLVDLAKF